MKSALIFGLVVIILGCVGEGDYRDAVEQQRLYEQMVCEGVWPEYQGPVDCMNKKFDTAP
jgi:hypothetical protein